MSRACMNNNNLTCFRVNRITGLQRYASVQANLHGRESVTVPWREYLQAGNIYGAECAAVALDKCFPWFSRLSVDKQISPLFTLLQNRCHYTSWAARLLRRSEWRQKNALSADDCWSWAHMDKSYNVFRIAWHNCPSVKLSGKRLISTAGGALQSDFRESVKIR